MITATASIAGESTLASSARARRLALILFTGLAVCAFAPSFHALMDFAARSGVPPALAWTIPVLLDGTVIVGAVGLLLARATHLRPTLFRGVIIAGGLISLALNVWHSCLGDFTWRAVAVGALPPVALWGVTECVVQMADHWLIRDHGPLVHPEPAQASPPPAAHPIFNNVVLVDHRPGPVAHPRATPEPGVNRGLNRGVNLPEPGVDHPADRYAALAALVRDRGLTREEVALQHGVSLSTVKRALRRAREVQS